MGNSYAKMELVADPLLPVLPRTCLTALVRNRTVLANFVAHLFQVGLSTFNGEVMLQTKVSHNFIQSHCQRRMKGEKWWLRDTFVAFYFSLSLPLRYHLVTDIFRLSFGDQCPKLDVLIGRNPDLCDLD